MESVNPSKDRPVFLTIICILSYVGLGMNILNGLIGAFFGRVTLLFAPFMKSLMEEEIDLDHLPEGFRRLAENSRSVVQKAMEYATTMSLLAVVLYVIALFGVINMWQLKKTGFYLYTGAKIFILLIPFMFLGFNFFSYLAFAINGFFVLLFIILYAVNLKHMN